ncbi:hypothetical protein [Arthrobacter sp. Soil762]|uniref:hypothetical protein n=1 Tax=Arthrobacter sp. Soil762 TaxID=1736401 RepID=UPI0006F9592E|nr:hypothetical protein [Arthrobacter sp. Soil762]KRE72572.1 hypothetical protein ASG77_07835 [Arthrobacter sp. Soil762]
MAGQNVIVALSISPQVLVSQQLGTADAAIYTVPASTSVKVAQGSICNVSGLILPPVLTLGATSTTGGSLVAGSWYWKVTAKSASGETLGSNEVTATTTGSSSSQPLSWTATPGAASYNVYRGTTAGGQNALVTNVTTTSFTDVGAAGTALTVPTVSTYATPVTVYLSIVQTGGAVDGTHRVIHAYTLAANDTLPLKDLIGGAMLGPGDRIAGYSGTATAVDIVVTGTVHA